MGKTLRTGACLLAIVACVGADAMAKGVRKPSKCADANEVSALQTAAVQQELMDAALGCGDTALHKFNAFQTAFGPELRRSDRTLLDLFKRVYGGARGDAAYNLFKTNMASKAEIRRVHDIGNFCTSADLVFAAALAANKPTLTDFVSGVQIGDTDDSPVGKCDIQVAVTLQGAMAAPNIVPKPNPLRVAMAPQPLRTPASLTTSATPADLAPPAPPPAAAAPAPQQAAAQQPAPAKEEKKSGWLSGLFH
jgi:hypothetical protein